MAEKVTKIPNQNNINSVITAQIENMADIVKVVVKAATEGAIKYSSDTVDKLKTYSDVVETLFSNKGAVIVLTKAADTFQKLNGKDIKEENIKKGFKAVKMMQSYIKDLVENLSELKSLPEINLTGITTIFENINSLRAALEKDDKNNKPMWFKFFLLKLEINRAVELIKEISNTKIDNDNISAAQTLTANIKNVYKEFTSVLESFNEVNLKDGNLYFAKLRLIKRIIGRTIKSLNNIDAEALKTLNKNFGKKNNDLTGTFDIIVNITESISKSTKSFITLWLFKKIVIRGINAFGEILDAITINLSERKILGKKAIENIKNILEIVDTLVNISKKIIVLGLLAAPVLLAVTLITFVFLPSISLFIGTLWLLSKTIRFVKKGINKGFKALSTIILSMLIIGASLVGLALLAPIFVASITLAIIPLILAIGLFSLIIWGAFKIIGKLSIGTVPNILAFGLMIGILCGTLLLSGLAILVAAKIAEEVQVGFWKLTGMILGMVALTGILVLLGMGVAALTPFITTSMVGLGQMLGLIGLILGIGLTINILANVEVKSEDAKEKTNEIVSAVNLIRDELKSLEGTKKEWKQDKKVLKQVNRTVKTIAKIAENLNSLQNITLDQSTIISNVTSIMLFTQKLQDLMNKLLFGGTIDETDNTETSGNFITRNLGSIFHKGAADRMRKEMKSNKKVLNKVDKVINKLVGVGQSLVSIGELKLTDEFKTTIETNIGEIFGFIDYLEKKIYSFMSSKTIKSDQIITAEDVIGSSRKSKRQWKKSGKALSKVEATIATIYGITDTLNILKDFKFVEGNGDIKGTKDIIIGNVGIMFGAVEEIATIVNGKSDNIKVKKNDIAKMMPLVDFVKSINDGIKDLAASNETVVKNNIDNYIRLIDRLSIVDIEAFSPISKHINDINASIDSVGKINSKQFESNIDNYVRFVDKVNAVDVNKLETSAKMFEQMASFSNSIKGDFEKLAESLGEKLLPVLEELKEVMSEIPDKLDDGFQNTSASIAATAAPVTRENVTAQVNRENKNLTTDEVDKIVTSRMNEKAKADANSVASKIDELISLFKGYGGEHAVVQTI